MESVLLHNTQEMMNHSGIHLPMKEEDYKKIRQTMNKIQDILQHVTPSLEEMKQKYEDKKKLIQLTKKLSEKIQKEREQLYTRKKRIQKLPDSIEKNKLLDETNKKMDLCYDFILTNYTTIDKIEIQMKELQEKIERKETSILVNTYKDKEKKQLVLSKKKVPHLNILQKQLPEEIVILIGEFLPLEIRVDMLEKKYKPMNLFQKCMSSTAQTCFINRFIEKGEPYCGLTKAVAMQKFKKGITLMKEKGDFSQVIQLFSKIAILIKPHKKYKANFAKYKW